MCIWHLIIVLTFYEYIKGVFYRWQWDILRYSMICYAAITTFGLMFSTIDFLVIIWLAEDRCALNFFYGRFLRHILHRGFELRWPWNTYRQADYIVLWTPLIWATFACLKISMIRDFYSGYESELVPACWTQYSNWVVCAGSERMLTTTLMALPFSTNYQSWLMPQHLHCQARLLE